MEVRVLEEKLRSVLREIRQQPDVGKLFPADIQSYEDQIELVSEFIASGECGLAYEYLVCLLESFPFQLSGAAAVALLEVGLTFGYKTERPEDAEFNRHQ